MKVFLSGLESSENNIIDYYISNKKNIPYILASYYYIRKKENLIDKMLIVSDNLIIDSGAHSFQKGKEVDWELYTKEYSNWIKKNDCDKVVGYFEMDVDNIIGYDKVLELRKILESVSNKIIPVWHKNRGIDEYKKMCKNYAGKVVAITGFKNEDIKDKQYMMFLKYAKKYNCKVHCLGMTRMNILNNIPFDYVDSSTWKQAGNYGEYRQFKNGKLIINKYKGKYKTIELDKMNFEEFLKMQKYFYVKWRKVCKD
jgi:hypothetical protein